MNNHRMFNQMNIPTKFDSTQNFFCAYIKRLRACGGCLGTERRRRTWYTAISFGEPYAGFDPKISEWGNPPLYVEL